MGYIIYLDKKEEYSDKKEKNGKQRDYADYLLIPTWIIGCSYSENGSNDDQTDMNSYDGSEQQDLNYQRIFIDAQTGKLHDPKEVGSERYYADLHWKWAERIRATRATIRASWKIKQKNLHNKTGNKESEKRKMHSEKDLEILE